MTQAHLKDEGSNEEIMESLRNFLTYLESKKIINITEVMQDKAQMHAIIQDIMKIDLKEFSKQSQQKMLKIKSTSGNSSAGTSATNSQLGHKRVRQGTPVNIKSTQDSNPKSHQ